MIRTTTLAAVLLAGVSFPALATRQEPPRQSGGATSAQATAQASSAARATVRTHVTNSAAALGGSGGNARATGGAGGSANGTQVVNVTGGATQDTRQVPAFFAGSAIPPQCGAGFNAGGANQHGTGALGFAWETESCRKDRLANRLAALGQPAAGVALLCSMGEIREAMAAAGTPCPGDAPRVVSVSVTPMGEPVARPAPVNTSGLSDDACRTLRARGMDVRGCP